MEPTSSPAAQGLTNTSKEPAEESRVTSWAGLAVLIVTAINGLIAFYGWNEAKSIGEHEASAKAKLDAIQQVVERGYILYARASERDFIELVANSPGIELTGRSADLAKASIREDKVSLDILEREISQERRQPVRFLMEGYLQIIDGHCKEAIAALEHYPKEIPIKYLLLATAQKRCGNPQKSIELNNRVRDLPFTKPNDRIKAKALNNNGNTMSNSGNYDDARSYYEAALKADPSLYGVNYNLAALHSRMGKQDDAVQRLCAYSGWHDGNVIDEVESDPENAFVKLRESLGSSWKDKLTARLSSCK
jgi:tetratricopeptide (TPR) repeat protein